MFEQNNKIAGFNNIIHMGSRVAKGGKIMMVGNIQNLSKS